MSFSLKNKLSIFFLAITFVGIFVFKNNPQLTENLYSTSFYPLISVFLRILFGWIPFSVGDIFYTIIFIVSIYFLIKKGKLLWENPKVFFSDILYFLSIIFLLFHFLWGFNYYRLPLSEKLQLDTHYTQGQLLEITGRCIIRANILHHQLAKKDTLWVEAPLQLQEIYHLAPEGYKTLSKEIPVFNFSVNSLKSSLYSTFLTYMGYSGYLNPFTNEAQVNHLPQGYSVFVTATHEMAHQLGYAAENEANFIGYLAALHNKNPYFKYGASLFALRYCLLEVKKISPELHHHFTLKIRKGILKDFQRASDFWEQYQNPMEIIFKKSYDVFLKANNQKQGIQSYNYVTGMLINYHLKEGFTSL